MPHSINSDICEGVAQCALSCPVNCIKEAPGKNTKGTNDSVPVETAAAHQLQRIPESGPDPA